MQKLKKYAALTLALMLAASLTVSAATTETISGRNSKTIDVKAKYTGGTTTACTVWMSHGEKWSSPIPFPAPVNGTPPPMSIPKTHPPVGRKAATRSPSSTIPTRM